MIQVAVATATRTAIRCAFMVSARGLQVGSTLSRPASQGRTRVRARRRRGRSWAAKARRAAGGGESLTVGPDRLRVLGEALTVPGSFIGPQEAFYASTREPLHLLAGNRRRLWRRGRWPGHRRDRRASTPRDQR